jgi:hypothetical protein
MRCISGTVTSVHEWRYVASAKPDTDQLRGSGGRRNIPTGDPATAGVVRALTPYLDVWARCGAWTLQRLTGSRVAINTCL